MNTRIQKLRDQSKNASASISVERALLVTEFYQSDMARTLSIPVKRALTLKHILEHKELWLAEGELLVGERGPAPKATPTYPEICLHNLTDLDIFNVREKVSFKVDETVKEIYRDTIIPYWEGRTVRDRIFSQMSSEWKAAYAAGIFTEFQEQRTPGHTALDNKIYHKGMLDFIQEIEAEIRNLDWEADSNAYNRQEQLQAMKITAEALISYAQRYAHLLSEKALEETNCKRKNELLKMAEICRRVPARKPETFWEAIQYYWFVHVGVITELNPWDAFNPGRLDQHLYPFLKKDMEMAIINKDTAEELLQSLWIKFNNHPAPPKIGVTANESNTYVDFVTINLGGLKSDGTNAVNDLSYMILDVIESMKLLQPNSMCQISKKTPDRFLKRALNVVKRGYGQPAMFNSDGIVQQLLQQGKKIEDARDGGCSGCVESGAFGKEAYLLTGYLNLCKILEMTLNNGMDPLTHQQIGLQTGNIESFSDYESLFLAFEKQLHYFVSMKIKGNNIIEQIHAQRAPVPFLSLLIDDCIKKGKDYNAGGARYNTTYIQIVGMGTITDSLTALKKHVFEEQSVSLNSLTTALSTNFNNNEKLRNILLYHTPKYGNDDDYADDELSRVFMTAYKAINGRPNTRGGVHRIMMLPTTVHVYFGNKLGASADGRLAHEPISEGISPVQGMDRNGPTAVVRSAAKFDQVLCGGSLLNQKFLPSFMKTEDGITKIAQLIRTYFRMDGHHIQFNVVTKDTLVKAQKSPDDYRDLIVRVAGYSDYFVDLTNELQEEIIRRTEQIL